MSSSAARGFTLLEILTVFTILAVMFAALVPMFRDSFIDLQVRDTARNLAATVRFAQEQAIVHGIEYRVCISTKDREYWVSREADPEEAEEPDTFVTVYADNLRPTLFPDSVRLRRVSTAKGMQDDRRVNYIACYPNGRIGDAEVSLQGPDRRSFTLTTTARMGGVKLEGPRR